MNLKKLLKKTVSLILASSMVLSMAACGGKGGQNQSASNEPEVKKEFVWVPEFFELEGGNSFYNAKVKNGYLYYEKYIWDEESKTQSYSIESLSLTDGSVGDSFPIAVTSAEEGENRHVTGFMPMDDGIQTVEGSYFWNEETGESKEEYFICKYDKTGTRTSETDITDILKKDENNSYISSAQMDGEGRMYLASDSVIFLFDAQGKYHGEVKLEADNWISAMGVGKDGKMYASFYNRNGNGMIFQEVDFEGKALGASYECPMHNNADGGLSQGITKDFLIVNNSSLYEFDMAGKTTEEVLNWLDCDINSSYVNVVYALEDGRIACFSNNWEDNTAELAVLSKKPASEVKEKINITIAGLYADSAIESAAVKFNKSNDTYHISMKSYYDSNSLVVNGDENNYEQLVQDAMIRLNNDITSDNCPDMLMLNNIDIERFAAKGVFEDLNVWLDNSTKLKKTDFFENILEASTYSDVLVTIPKDFSLTTLVGKASDLGTEPGWTVDEMIAYSKKNPKAEVLNYFTRERALAMMLQYNQGSYVNWETGECNFQDESFIQLLEFASQFPDEMEYNEDDPSEPAKIGNGDLLLSETYLYDFQSIQMPAALFNDDVCYIGYPNENGDSGTYLQVSNGLAMTAKSECKEGAWAFLESYLTDEGGMYSHGFSSKKDKFAKDMEAAMKVEYVKDENGEIMKDENGDPIIANAGGSIGYGDDWTYTYHVTTQEEADLLEELIRIAKPATVTDVTVLNIIKEEAEAFFKGQRSAADVAGIIQSRVQVYVNENR